MLGFQNLSEHQRGVVLRLGRFSRVAGPGFAFACPFIEKMIVVDMQPATLFIPEQEVSTRDKSLLQVDAEVSYRVVDPSKAVTQVEDYASAVRLFCAITFRSVLGDLDKDELLKDRQKTNRLYRELLSATLSNWGIEVSDVDIRA